MIFQRAEMCPNPIKVFTDLKLDLILYFTHKHCLVKILKEHYLVYHRPKYRL